MELLFVIMTAVVWSLCVAFALFVLGLAVFTVAVRAIAARTMRNMVRTYDAVTKRGLAK